MNDFWKQILYYNTNKVVQIRSWKLGVLYYFFVLVVLAYVGGYAIYYKKGYQEFGDLIGSTYLKVKGVALVGDEKNIENSQVWDAEDVVYPPKENDALFVTTAVTQTKGQYRGVCLGKDSDEKCPCTRNKLTSNGIETGVCNDTSNLCYISSWCPIANNSITASQPLNFIQDFTVFVRVTVKFPKFNQTLSNVGDETAPIDGKNQFTVGKLIQNSIKSSNITDILKKGGLFAILCKWICDFDKSSTCEPVFEMLQIDDLKGHAQGYSFRYSNYYYITNSDNNKKTEMRDLYKVYGARFIFLTYGTGGKFSVLPLLVNIGSGLALITLATLISDFIALKCLPQRKFYNKVKFEEISEHAALHSVGSNNHQPESEPLLPSKKPQVINF